MMVFALVYSQSLLSSSTNSRMPHSSLLSTTPFHRLCVPVAIAPSPRDFYPLPKPEESKVGRADIMQWRTTASGFKYVDEVLGSGSMPGVGQQISVHYTVSLLSCGGMVETSIGKSPICFELGSRDALWNEALEGMRVGGRRRVIVPPSAEASPESLLSSEDEEPTGEVDSLRFEFELVRVFEDVDDPGLLDSMHTASASRSRQFSLLRMLYALSFVPHFLPYATATCLDPRNVSDFFVTAAAATVLLSPRGFRIETRGAGAAATMVPRWQAVAYRRAAR